MAKRMWCTEAAFLAVPTNQGERKREQEQYIKTFSQWLLDSIRCQPLMVHSVFTLSTDYPSVHMIQASHCTSTSWSNPARPEPVETFYIHTVIHGHHLLLLTRVEIDKNPNILCTALFCTYHASIYTEYLLFIRFWIVSWIKWYQ